jgi:hypothetical protein
MLHRRRANRALNLVTHKVPHTREPCNSRFFPESYIYVYIHVYIYTYMQEAEALKSSMTGLVAAKAMLAEAHAVLQAEFTIYKQQVVKKEK